MTDWAVKLRNDILALHNMRADAPVGMDTWLDKQLGENEDNLAQCRLVLTEAMLTSVLQLVNSSAAPAGCVSCTFKDPVEGTVLCPVQVAAGVLESQKRDATLRMQHRIREMERSAIQQSVELERNLQRLRIAETQLEEERGVSARRAREIGRLRKELQEANAQHKVSSDKVTRLSMSLAQEAHNVHVLTSRLGEREAAPQTVEETPKSGLHRLFSSTGPRAVGRRRLGRASHVSEHDVTALLADLYPELCKDDVGMVALEVAADVNDSLQALDECSEVLDGAEQRMRKMSGTMAEGIGLARETKDVTAKLAERCKTLEQQIEEKDMRVEMLEQALGHQVGECKRLDDLEGDLRSLSCANRQLQSAIHTKETQREEIDSFLSDELRSMRDAFTIKLQLANEEVEVMKQRHVDQVNEMRKAAEQERALLHRRIQQLEARELDVC